MKHYTKEELELYRNGKMSVLGRISCACHLRECEICTQIMEELKDDDHLIARLRSSVRLFKELAEEKQPQTN